MFGAVGCSEPRSAEAWYFMLPVSIFLAMRVRSLVCVSDAVLVFMPEAKKLLPALGVLIFDVFGKPLV